MSFQLRNYQLDAVEKIRAAFKRAKSVLYVLSTGGGKSAVFSYIATSAAEKGKRVAILVHRDELLRQSARAFTEMGIPFGLIKPGEPETSALLQIASTWTLARRLDRWSKFDLLVFDEAHHLPSATFSSVCSHFPDAFKLMVTATPERLDGRGLKEFAEEMVIGPSMAELCDLAYLARCQAYAPLAPVDLSSVHTRMGEYAQNELEAVMDHSGITGVATEHYAKHLKGAPAVCFCVTLDHCQHVARQFREAGWNAAVIDGSMRSRERQSLIDDLANGRLNVLVSCQLLTEGVDVPPARGVILLRPTKSLTLYLQMCGRGMRPKPDGAPMILLDHVGNSLYHGLPDAPRKWSLDGHEHRGGETPCKVCPGCDAVLALGCQCCSECGYEFSRERAPQQHEGKLILFDAETARLRRYGWLARQWRTSAKGNDYINFEGWNVVVFERYGGWRWCLSGRSGEQAFGNRRHDTADAAKTEALVALISAVEHPQPSPDEVLDLA